VPVLEPEIGAAALEVAVHKEPELRLGRQTSTLRRGILVERVIAGEDGPIVGDVQWDWSIQCPNL